MFTFGPKKNIVRFGGKTHVRTHDSANISQHGIENQAVSENIQNRTGGEISNIP